MPLDAYVAKAINSTMDFNGISSYKQQAPFFSPKAEQNATPVADLYCLREAYRRKDGNLVASLKYNLLFNVKHDFCWRYKGTKGDKWYVTVASFPASGQVVVNVRLVTSAGHNWHYFVVEPLKDLMLVPVFSIQEVEVCKCQWRGPAWLTSYLGRPLRSAEFGVVAEKLAGPMSLMTLACEEACFFCF